MANFVFPPAVDLESPPWDRETTGLWIDVPKPILSLMRGKGINSAEAIHAAQHAFLNRFAMAASLKTECKVPEKEYKTAESQRKLPGRYVSLKLLPLEMCLLLISLIIYDAVGNIGGVAAKAFDHGRPDKYVLLCSKSYRGGPQFQTFSSARMPP